MVLFTYTDYLRCKKLLQDDSLTLQENSTEYLSSNKKQTIHHSHDKLYRDLLNNKKEFNLFLQDFFSYSLKDTFIKYNRDFITKNYSNKYSDIIFKLLKYPAYLLVEHQSYVDHSIPYRIYQYYSLILDDAVDSNKVKSIDYKIPLITPIILYTGNQSWNLIPNFQDHQLDYNYNNNLNNGKLSLAYNFVNIHDFSKEELLKNQSMISYAMAIDKCKNVSELIDTIYSVYNLISKEQMDYLYRMIKYILKPIIPKKVYMDLLKKFDKEEESYMEELIERMKKDLEYRRKKAISEGKAQGMAQGIAEGKAEGRLEGRLEGKLEANIENAKKMLARNMAIKDISDITGLSIKQINKLKTA